MSPEIYGEEYLGRPIRVISSSNSTLIGITGTVMNETKNTFRVLCENKEKIVPKSVCQFSIEIEGKFHSIEGNLICFRPENRLKELRRISKNIRRMN